MSKLTIFDKYTTPDDWKENALEPERSRKKIYVKRFSAAALICTFAVALFAAYGLMHMTENKPESGRDSAQSIESQNAHDTDLNNSSDSFFIAERSGVHFRGYIAQKYENSYMLYSYDGDSDSYSLMSVSFTDDCKFYGEQNGEIKSYNYDIGDEVIVNFDGMVMESYPAQINSCSIFQKVDSLKDGECLIDSMQTYFSAKVAEVLNTEAGERTIKVEAMKDGAAYTVYNLCGFVYDEFNNVIPFEQLKEGDLIKVGYNGNLELSDVSEISTDIIQKTPQRDFIVSKYDSDGQECFSQLTLEDEADSLKLDAIINQYVKKIEENPGELPSDLSYDLEYVIERSSTAEKYHLYVTDLEGYFSTDYGCFKISRYLDTKELTSLLELKCLKIAEELEYNGECEVMTYDGKLSFNLTYSHDRLNRKVKASMSVTNLTSDESFRFDSDGINFWVEEGTESAYTANDGYITVKAGETVEIFDKTAEYKSADHAIAYITFWEVRAPARYTDMDEYKNDLSPIIEIPLDNERQKIQGVLEADGRYEALSDDGKILLSVEYSRDASEHKIIVKTTYKNLSDEAITIGGVHSDDAAILHRYGEEALRNCDYETLYLKPGEEKVLCDCELIYKKWGYYILDIYLGFEYFDPETMQGDGAGSRLSASQIEEEIYISPNEFSQS